MAELQTITGFDKAERERVQVALRRYMEEHGIGTPTLQVRIIEADTPRHREIPLSTLQRFIGGSHHTNDHHVALCHAFVRELPYYGEGQDIVALGNALSAFYLVPKEGFEEAVRTQKLSQTLAGSYELIADRTREVDSTHGQKWKTSSFDIPYARATFAPSPSNKFLKVTESVFNPRRVYPFDVEKAETHHIFEGVFVTLEERAFIVLRHTLTRLPKIYWIREETKPRIWALGTEIFLPFGTAGNLFLNYVDLVFERQDQASDAS